MMNTESSPRQTGINNQIVPVTLALAAVLLPLAGFYLAHAEVFRIVYPLGTVVAVVLLGWIGLAAVRTTRVAASRQQESSLAEGLETVVSRVAESALDSESAGRKLAIQVGDTLAATARIASRASAGKERVQALSDQVSEGAAAVEEIQAAIESLARRISEQGSVVDQSAAAVEQMSASIDNVAAVAREKKAAAEQLLEATDKGNDTVTRTEKIIGEVVDQVGSVHQMIGVIDDIAARTNLLAMNAAIEAAHAGASGRGFAVVAGEIRSLAGRTAENARHVAETLKALGAKISEARGAGTETGNAFRHIETEAREVSNAFLEIGNATGELSTGTREVVSAVETLRTISREIVGSAEEMRVGARDVTRVITTTRDTATDTVETINVISDASTNVTEATERISTLSIANNEQIDRLIRTLQEHHASLREPRTQETREDTRQDTQEDQARRRLQMITMMLKHISWVARVRMMIDGRIEPDPAELTDARSCDLGQWLALEGKTVITDPRAYRRLYDTHTKLHELSDTLVRAAADGSAPADRESVFLELLEASRVITELLTTFQNDSVRWTRDVEVHVPAFDAHHKQLFAQIDTLYQALQSGAGNAVLADVFDELIRYTGYHFSTEEAVFEHFGYPQCTEHRKAHAELVERVTQLRADLDKGKTLVAVDVMEFLRDWVTGHIKKCDKLYSSFLADKDVNGFLARQR